jgi:microcystin-dependent protein
MDGFIGEVKYFGGTYAPSGWLFCEGQLLPINQYTPLYSLIGTQFGGDGKTNFNLPDLRGRMPMCTGQGTNLTNRQQGQTGGTEGVILTQQTIPAHDHTVKCDSTTGGRGIKNAPKDNLFANTNLGAEYAAGATGTQLMKNDMVNPEGQNAAHENMPPWLCLRAIICVYGYYPIRP